MIDMRPKQLCKAPFFARFHNRTLSSPVPMCLGGGLCGLLSMGLLLGCLMLLLERLVVVHQR